MSDSEGGSSDSSHKVTDTYRDISRYFSKEEWAEIGVWEKVRYRNVKQNYAKLRELGMNAPKPLFMSRGRRPPKPPVCNTSDSDEEWTPKCQTIVKNVRQPRGFTKKRIQAQNVCTSSKRCLEFSSSEEVEKNEQILAADGEENKEQLKGFPEDTSNTISAGTAQSVLHTNSKFKKEPNHWKSDGAHVSMSRGESNLWGFRQQASLTPCAHVGWPRFYRVSRK
ncbi:uncharacterized protein LOC142474565 [Ascaphus truei]|uniref:uncharacterized protein LOC142474565 n=1 Tax=Ascaphus truei TaxID=8439 RepID=UPI003F5AB088